MDDVDKRIDELENRMLSDLKGCFNRIRQIKNSCSNVNQLLDELEKECGIESSVQTEKTSDERHNIAELIESIYLDIYRETGEDFVSIEDIVQRTEVKGISKDEVLKTIDDLRLQDYLIQLNDTIKYKYN